MSLFEAMYEKVKRQEEDKMYFSSAYSLDGRYKKIPIREGSQNLKV